MLQGSLVEGDVVYKSKQFNQQCANRNANWNELLI